MDFFYFILEKSVFSESYTKRDCTPLGVNPWVKIMLLSPLGALSIKGVGDTKVKVMDEWACLLDRADGSKQVVQGVAVEKITSAFPNVNVSKAVKEVKAAAPNNKLLQKLKIPELAGGEPDVLLGIFYENCQPQKIHTLPSGLFIAKLQLTSHERKWTGDIGGPHKSFEILAHQAGDVSRLMAHFVEGLQEFRKLGAPKIYSPPMSWSDVQFAQKFNKTEIEELVGEVFDQDNDLESIEPDIFNTKADNLMGVVNCSICGDSFPEENSKIAAEFKDMFTDKELQGMVTKMGGDERQVMISCLQENDDNLRELKMIAKLQELGLSLEYRCPNCRDCNSCRNAPDTERISLREEAEDQAVRDSVKIDWKEKKIICSLPLRGKEEDFLSNNREIALKVLNAQCKKVKNDIEAKNTVVKSFQKLFDGNFARKFSDLTENQKRKIDGKPIAHYLPWRVVHKASISTPCRTVMDGSSRTPLLPNGKGGRCLNDLCVKGRISSLNLLNML